MPSVTSHHPVAEALQILLPRLLAGDGRSIERFVLAAGPAILRVVRQILGTHHPDVPDVVQEASFAVIGSLPRFRGDSSLLHFVWRIAVPTAMNARRRPQLRERSIEDTASFEDVPDAESSPFGLAVAGRRREAFRQLLDELPTSQAEAICLHCVLGWTIEEAAESTGVPANTMRTRLATARAALRKRLADDPELNELLRGAS
jgi:RNA polymerase sigma-70 factor (ECF subfamily)